MVTSPASSPVSPTVQAPFRWPVHDNFLPSPAPVVAPTLHHDSVASAFPSDSLIPSHFPSTSSSDNAVQP